jgi:hypothetical protein
VAVKGIHEPIDFFGFGKRSGPVIKVNKSLHFLLGIGGKRRIYSMDSMSPCQLPAAPCSPNVLKESMALSIREFSMDIAIGRGERLE